MSDAIRIDQQFSLTQSYPIVFARDILGEDLPILAELLAADDPEQRRVAVVDSGLAESQPRLVDDLTAYLENRGLPLAEQPLVVPGGEASKDGFAVVDQVVGLLNRRNICRHGVLIAVGGGAMLDAAGMAASLFHRGVRLLRMPSTTLSQGDSGVGVKNGVNAHGQKNLLGCFAPPYAVLNDLQLLRTLPEDHIMDGIAEALKVAAIKDADFFQYLEDNIAASGASDWETIDEAVIRSAEIHAEHIATGGDPFEMGQARPLDFGHWAAHRLEVLSEYEIRHGQAVAIGILLDTLYAGRIGMIAAEDARRIAELARRMITSMPKRLLGLQDADGRLLLLEGVRQFREHLGGHLSITLPTAVGQAVEVHEIDSPLMKRCIEELTQ